ncbi:oligosaccharide flippase family protein [Enterococcus casseliflavus]|uniref:oligosaccharide flippase family protein n=1 Tax=Enterococcus casseliflavus TaxID=37734 RepID=UPI001432CA69|nr:oligosaccharide flippase family protein [Enterococcus casseliflavus]
MKINNIIFKNLSYAFTSNIIVLLVSSFITLILPKIIGVENFSYWQLYLLYSTYTAFFHLGWNDGIYLELGGENYDDIRKKNLFSQFYLLILLNIVLVIIVNLASNFFMLDVEKLLVLRLMTISTLLTIPRGFLTSILQATNRIKENSLVTSLEKISFIILLIFLIVFFRNKVNFKSIIILDIISKLISFIYATYFCKEIVFEKVKYFSLPFSNIFKNISSGIQISMSYIASTLIVNVIRMYIIASWNILVFGQISLILSLSNLVTVFVNSIGMVIFPIVKKKQESELSQFYQIFRSKFTNLSLLGLLLFFPIKSIMDIWLPSYSEGLKFLIVLFPLCIFDGKMSMIFITFFKSMRKETTLLVINISTVILSILLGYLSAYVIKNLFLSVLVILIVLIFRSIVSEIYLSKLLSVSTFKNIALELIFIVWFMLLGLNFSLVNGFLLYLFTMIIYFFSRKI